MNDLNEIILELRSQVLHRIARIKGLKCDEEDIRGLVKTMNDSHVMTTLKSKHDARWWSLRYWRS